MMGIRLQDIITMIVFIGTIYIGVLAIKEKLHTILEKIDRLEVKQDKHNDAVTRLTILENRFQDHCDDHKPFGEEA